LISFAGIEHLDGIAQLYAASNKIVNIEKIRFLKSWNSLKILDLSGNNIEKNNLFRKVLIFYCSKIEVGFFLFILSIQEKPFFFN
jgi:hypothetical protein